MHVTNLFPLSLIYECHQYFVRLYIYSFCNYFFLDLLLYILFCSILIIKVRAAIFRTGNPDEDEKKNEDDEQKELTSIQD